MSVKMTSKKKNGVNGLPKKVSQPTTNHQVYWICLGLVTIASFATRLYKISEPDHVCWDETHFGKMGSWYINRTFFFDVHPPLGKMLIGLAGKLTGYNGTFPFLKPGDKFEDTPYVGMRIFCATLGSLIVPFMFVATYDLSKSVIAGGLAATLLIFDVGFITLSQYILLDPLLLFFISGSFMSSVRVTCGEDIRSKPFSFLWFMWLTLTGTFLSGAVGVKFVGLFIVAVVGLQTISDLWLLLGDTKLPLTNVVGHFIARAATLIVLPITLYVFYFWIHLTVLSKSGSGDGFFSSAFQSQLEGNSLYNASMPREVAYGSVITLKSVKTGGGYLHSHWHLYPEGVGARQQQVTGYSHKDENNKWIIKRYDREADPERDDIEVVKDGDLIRLEHVPTRRNLHSHREVAPVTKRHFQVTCYGENGTGDANDVWRIQIFDDDKKSSSSESQESIKTVTTSFRLIHYFASCALTCNNKQLPKWGYEQMEIACSPNIHDKTSSIWNIEDNFFPRLPNVSVDVYAPSFWRKFLESHAVMFQGNSGLKPKEGEVTSRPWQWPINLRGQFFSGNEYKIYLLGNPVIWWLNLSLLFVYAAVQSIILIRRQRGCQESPEIKIYNDQLTLAGSWLFISWMIHYFPFYAMGRVLYFHHYFPAAIFSSCLSAVLLDYVIWRLLPLFFERLPKPTFTSLSHILFGILLSTIVYSFYLFYPLSYGIIPESREQGHKESTSSLGSNMSTSSQIASSSVNSLDNLRWLNSWEF